MEQNSEFLEVAQSKPLRTAKFVIYVQSLRIIAAAQLYRCNGKITKKILSKKCV